MTKTARVYGGSLYDLAAEENLDGQIMEQMNEIRQIFRENPGYLKLLGEPAIPEEERLKMIEEAFGSQAERYLVNFLKLLCERKILREFAGCCEEFTRRYNLAHGISEAVVTSAVKLSDQQMEALKVQYVQKFPFGILHREDLPSQSSLQQKYLLLPQTVLSDIRSLSV